MINLKRISTKSEGLVRYLMVKLLSDRLPLYIVNEHLKSGGTWIGQMLSKALEVPFPRNQFPELRSCIMHGHYINSWGMKNVVILWRDGRDVMVSWYHHCLFVNQSGRNKPLVNMMRNKLGFSNYHNVSDNLPKFMEFCFMNQPPMRFSWKDFANSWINVSGVIYTKYENFRYHPTEELQKVVLELTGTKLSYEKALEIVEEFSFEKQTGRKSGQEQKSSFLRKGIVGDWKNNFTQESCEIFDHFAGKELIDLGYELNHEWAKLK